MPLGQQQPVVARMLDQQSAGLHQPPLQAGQRPLRDRRAQRERPIFVIEDFAARRQLHRQNLLFVPPSVLFLLIRLALGEGRSDMPLFKWLSTRASTIGLTCSRLACISLALSSRRGMHLPCFWLRLMLYR